MAKQSKPKLPTVNSRMDGTAAQYQSPITQAMVSQGAMNDPLAQMNVVASMNRDYATQMDNQEAANAAIPAQQQRYDEARADDLYKATLPNADKLADIYGAEGAGDFVGQIAGYSPESSIADALTQQQLVGNSAKIAKDYGAAASSGATAGIIPAMPDGYLARAGVKPVSTTPLGVQTAEIGATATRDSAAISGNARIAAAKEKAKTPTYPYGGGRLPANTPSASASSDNAAVRVTNTIRSNPQLSGIQPDANAGFTTVDIDGKQMTQFQGKDGRTYYADDSMIYIGE
jgi:hypothetical protein